jgi:hypothetical protein
MLDNYHLRRLTTQTIKDLDVLEGVQDSSRTQALVAKYFLRRIVAVGNNFW